MRESRSCHQCRRRRRPRVEGAALRPGARHAVGRRRAEDSRRRDCHVCV
ncbi:uncharacterized protein M6B38_177050 [Iris pallida]|uniref:Uncharacterized protein n=1 Tax=Iris pallida TaxID=29817 RepID=A0AAX6EQB9_IRIPA|nr:uncharacterized protein M6B38_177050 [Iris pallida]